MGPPIVPVLLVIAGVAIAGAVTGVFAELFETFFKIRSGKAIIKKKKLSSSGDSKLMSLTKDSNVIKIRRMLERDREKFDREINMANNEGYTPLMEATYIGDIDLVRILKENGALPRTMNRLSQNSIDIARDRGKEEILRILLE